MRTLPDKKIKYIVGVDEVGRGPLAGPVAVGAAIIHRDFSIGKVFAGIRDSKQLSLEEREAWIVKMNEQKKTGNLDYAVSFVSHTVIDSKGLSYAIRKALRRSLEKLKANPGECLVLLDGGLYAPKEFFFQETIIKGDEKEKIISIASIAAKVSRDEKMRLFAKKFRHFGFEKHKGYGTKEHRDAIRKYGICEIHRKSFLKKSGRTTFAAWKL